MNCRSLFLLMSLAILNIGFVCGANAAPTVKKLGANTSAATPVKTATLSSKSTTTPRTGSIRTTNVSTVKPATVVKTVSAKTDEADPRLSVGKYIHSTGVTSGVIKPIASAESATAASKDIISLSDRVSELSATVDGKQDILTPKNMISSGAGIIVTAVEANNGIVTINKDEITVPVGEPGSTNRANIWVE